MRMCNVSRGACIAANCNGIWRCITQRHKQNLKGGETELRVSPSPPPACTPVGLLSAMMMMMYDMVWCAGSSVPEGMAIHSVHGFVEELVVNDDPEYQVYTYIHVHVYTCIL